MEPVSIGGSCLRRRWIEGGLISGSWTKPEVKEDGDSGQPCLTPDRRGNGLDLIFFFIIIVLFFIIN